MSEVFAQKRLLLVLNPRAGRNKPRGPLFDAVCALCEGGYLVSIYQTRGPADATRVVEQHGEEFDVVAAAGGDGTLNEVVSGLLQLSHPPLLGYFPQGSTNDFAASLRIPSDPVQAAQVILKNDPHSLDIGLWGERRFVYVASFGAFTRSSYSAPQSTKNALGHFAYLLEGIKDLDSLRPYRVKITADGEVLDGQYLFGAVCNSTSIGGLMRLNPEQVILDDGKFEMLLVPNPRTAADLQNLVPALLSQDYTNPSLIFRHVSALHVQTQEALPWSLDGEYAPSRTSVDIVNCAKALRILL